MIGVQVRPVRRVTFNAEPRDQARLAFQSGIVFGLMKDGEWRTLADIAESTGFPEASISARLRDFRKERFGGHLVHRRRRSPGQFEYRLVVKP